MVKMKDSGIEWIGEIPASWEVIKGKYLFTQRSSKGNKLSLTLLSPTQKYGVIPQSMYEELTGMKPVKIDQQKDLNLFKTIHKGDFCISLRSFEGGFEYSNYEGVVSPAYQVFYLIDNNSIDTYYKYLFKDKTFIDKMNSYTMSLRDGKNISFNDFGNTYITVPPKSEQQQIADFLDHKTAEIDGLIDKINTEIDTLKQYQSSVITQAVTKGLDPNVPMKDSGIEWIGEIPETWKMVKIKHLVNTVNLKDKLSNLNGRYIGLENAEKGTGKLIMTETTYPDEIYKICKKGNVLYSKLRPNLAKVLITPFDSCCTSEFEVLNTFNNRWIKYCLLSNGITEMTTAATYGVKMPRVNWEEVSNYKIPVPKNDEIEFINNYIDSKMLTVDNLIKQKQQQINQLTEYKNSLIFEYVTGKKQVKEAN
ncbi:restriction endonuclease subunit S [Ligilactobacillus salivarius]|uniref:restriction endonuclease subunit S n=1 Tax=Ligilactobacillus salivarius TaxID=1624 RepID=UPI001CBE973C|nr:restriction endonuclease subunit S [Ligilactobacillus salivarius]MBZ4032646.1 restriction endonuclease subunit S [Ligilactobacillus salivarius]